MAVPNLPGHQIWDDKIQIPNGLGAGVVGPSCPVAQENGCAPPLQNQNQHRSRTKERKTAVPRIPHPTVTVRRIEIPWRNGTASWPSWTRGAWRALKVFGRRRSRHERGGTPGTGACTPPSRRDASRHAQHRNHRRPGKQEVPMPRCVSIGSRWHKQRTHWREIIAFSACLRIGNSHAAWKTVLAVLYVGVLYIYRSITVFLL